VLNVVYDEILLVEYTQTSIESRFQTFGQLDSGFEAAQKLLGYLVLIESLLLASFPV
jgi:hypothetical protein